MANRDLFALGAALSNFGQVFSAMSRDQDERERREAERVEAEKARSQQEIAGISSQLPLTRSFDELRSLQRRADAADPQHQLGQDFQQRKAELEPGERLAIMKRAQEYQAVTGGTGAEALDFVGQPEAGQQPGEFQVPLTQPEVGRLVQEGNAPALEAFRQNQQEQQEAQQRATQAQISAMPDPTNADEAISQYRLILQATENREPTEAELAQVRESWASREAAQSRADGRQFGAMMVEVENGSRGAPRDVATLEAWWGRPLTDTQVAHFNRSLGLAQSFAEGPPLPTRSDVTAIEDQANQRLNLRQELSEETINPRTGEAYEEDFLARNYLGRIFYLEQFPEVIASGQYTLPSNLMDRAEMEFERQKIRTLGDVKVLDGIEASLDTPEARLGLALRGVDIAQFRAEIALQRAQVKSGVFSRAIQFQREEALRKSRREDERKSLKRRQSPEFRRQQDKTIEPRPPGGATAFSDIGSVLRGGISAASSAVAAPGSGMLTPTDPRAGQEQPAGPVMQAVAGVQEGTEPSEIVRQLLQAVNAPTSGMLTPVRRR